MDADDDRDFGAQVRATREARGWSQERLASEVGTTQSTIERIENSGSLRSRFRVEVASALGIDLPGANGRARGADGVYREPLTFLGERGLKVFAATEGGAGEMVISTDPIEIVARPWYLKNVREGYAVLVVGESMEPRYAPGEIVVVNPKAALIRGKDCIVHTAREGGDFRAMLKSYAGASEDTWRLRQLNPEKAITLKKREWPFCVRVVGRYDGG